VDWHKHKVEATTALSKQLQEVQTAAGDAVKVAVEDTLKGLHMNQIAGIDPDRVEGEQMVSLQARYRIAPPNL
jgi:hypothetical protein